MSEQAAFERVVASLYDAMLDETHWPATSALIDEACGLTGNALLVAEGPPDDIRVLFVGLYYRGQRRLDLEREYLDIYHPINEAIPRQLQLPAGQLVPIPDLYTAEELHTSRTYNEALPRYKNQQGLNVLLDGPGGSRMTWSLADPVASEGRYCTNRHWPARSGLYTLCTDKTFRDVVVSSTQRRTSCATRHRLGLTGRRDASRGPVSSGGRRAVGARGRRGGPRHGKNGLTRVV